MADQVQLFSCFGKFGCFTDLREFLFCVHDSGSLSALVQPEVKGQWDDERDGGYYLHYGVFSGHAVKDEEDDGYDVKFMIGTWRDTVRPRMICTGRLSANGMTGFFRYPKSQRTTTGLSEAKDADFDAEEEEFPFELLARPNSPTEERLTDSFLPLTRGKYWLEGRGQSNRLCVIETTAILTFTSDGTLSGTIEQVRGQYTTFKVKGTWKPDEIRFTAKGPCDNLFEFVGKPSVTCLRGFWRTEGFRPSDFDSESMVFDLKINSCEDRLWCEALHPFFRDEFRECVSLLLLSSLRGVNDPSKVVLPSDLWRRVLSFTSDYWFESSHRL